MKYLVQIVILYVFTLIWVALIDILQHLIGG